MGVHGLWTLLQPAGRKIQVDSLRGKVLAVDASIWIIQFLYVSSQKLSESYVSLPTELQIINGFVRRICRLLYFGIKPIFVFDGDFPALKKKTIELRRKNRGKEEQGALQKRAEKLIAKALQDIAALEESKEGEDQVQRKKKRKEEQLVEEEGLSVASGLFSEEESESEENYVRRVNWEISETLVSQYKTLLGEAGVKLKDFKKLDMIEQHRVIEKLKKREVQEQRERLMLSSNNLRQFSEVSVSEFIREIKTKQEQEKAIAQVSKREIQELGQKVGSHANLRYVLFEGNKKPEEVRVPQIKRHRPNQRKRLMKFLNRSDEQIKEDKLQNIFHGRQLELLESNPTEILTGAGTQQTEESKSGLIEEEAEEEEEGLFEFPEEPLPMKGYTISPKARQTLSSKWILDSLTKGEGQGEEEESLREQEPESSLERSFQSQSNLLKDFGRSQLTIEKSQRLAQKSEQDQLREVDKLLEEEKEQESVEWEDEANTFTINFDIEKLKEELQFSKGAHEYMIPTRMTRFADRSALANDMIEQIAEVLEMLGIPYIVSPFQADAQCGYLEQAGLVQGTITEDSDVLLFGSRNVYRHFFEEQKFTQYYDMRRIEKSLGLDREQLCLLALFLGSDYTEGVKGVGIVNGMEVVSTFRDLPSIKRFSAWAGDVQDNVKKSRKEKYSHEILQSEEEVEFAKLHLNFKKNWIFPQSFPSEEVVAGYLKPTVTQLREGFEFREPNFPRLEEYCRDTLQWKEREMKERFEAMEKRAKELRKKEQPIESYFLKEQKFAEYASKRLIKAIHEKNARKK